MKAYVEITGLIVRVGPECDSWGAPFEFACAGVGSAGRLEIKALAGDVARSRVLRAHWKALLDALAPFGFREIVYQHKGKFSTLFKKKDQE